MIRAVIEYQFMRNAVLAGLMASVVCGIMGVIVIEKKLVMMSGGIAHTSYGGVGLGYLLGFEPIIGAFAFSVLAALGVGAIKRRGLARSDVIISLFWSLGMALGILFIALMEGYPPDLSSYLFGSILSVTRLDIRFIVVLTVLVLAAILVLFADWKTYLFDDEFAGILGVNVVFLEYLLMVLIALTVVVLIRVVGIILVLALLTAPAATAALFTVRLKTRMLAATALGMVYTMVGLWLSYEIDIASGAAIVLLCVVCYLIIYTARAFIARSGRREAGQTK